MTLAATTLGLTNLQELTSVYSKEVVEMSLGGNKMSPTVESTFALPDRFHQVQAYPFGEMKIVVDGDTGWMVTPQGTRDLPPPQIADSKEGIVTDLLMLLFNRSQHQCQSLGPVDIEGTSYDRIYITGSFRA